jgi:transcription antitermination factor NusA-like protein
MVDIDGGAAGVIPEYEQLQLVNDQPLKQGDTVTAYVLDVENNLYTGRERTPVVLSMTIPDLVVGIVKSVVPEVASGRH